TLFKHGKPGHAGLDKISFPKIFRRVDNPVASFGLKLIQDGLPLPLLDGVPDALGNQADLLDQLNEGQPDELDYFHKPGWFTVRQTFLGRTNSSTMPPTSMSAPTA